jgi:putative colanic acid biosynthesis acetyltransferase WcaF
MGEFSAIGDAVEIYNLAPIRIGANSVVSQRSYLCTATHDYTKSNFPIYSLPITVGSSAWIAAAAFVAPGINIGEGAVVGACSVVTKDVPPWTVCAGNPCRVIKTRRLDVPIEVQLDVKVTSEEAESRVEDKIGSRQVRS